MGVVMAGFLALAVIIVVVWILLLQKSGSADRTELARQKEEEAERQRHEIEEAKLLQKGVALHCLGCGAKFKGPLPDTGCPECHVRSLVVTEADYQKTQQNSTSG